MKDESNSDFSVDLFDMMDIDEEDVDEFEEKMDEIEAIIEDCTHAIEAEVAELNETELMKKLEHEVILDYNIRLRPRS